MLEITDKHIQKLNDTDLRTLIGRLCEAELASMGLSTSSVTYGGHQDAPDGGIDVRVGPINIPSDFYIPRSMTGFQVKKTDMGPAQIAKEMRPKGKLRQAIIDLSESRGAYIIVSGDASVADSVLKDRLKAMSDALFDLDNSSNLKLDFYDSGRIASWVRCHPSIILWVREIIGEQIYGWQPFGSWSKIRRSSEDTFLADEVNRARLYKGTKAMSTAEGINCLREDLSKPGSAVRLIGLSGVGKTRLLQALFDESVGDNPLDKNQVCYTDTGFDPIPAPLHFVRHLIASNKPVILAVDNCSSKLHNDLSQLCKDSLVSLITVEFDITEGESGGTEVYRLKPASDMLIETLLRKRDKTLNEVNAQKIAEFAGGNARIAIALAEAIRKKDSLAHLSDAELFERLFWQKNHHDPQLLESAQACSLVYSFNFKEQEEELTLIGSLINKTSSIIRLGAMGIISG